jgi:hypothetical protein
VDQSDAGVCINDPEFPDVETSVKACFRPAILRERGTRDFDRQQKIATAHVLGAQPAWINTEIRLDDGVGTEKQRRLETDDQIVGADPGERHAELGFQPLVCVIFRAHRNDSSFDELEIIVFVDQAVRLHAANVLGGQLAK